MKFIDEAIIEIKAGDGGRGCVSFRREKFVPRGGPNGGDGGKGGDVFLVADQSYLTLLDFKYKPRFKAVSGGPGLGADKHGANGADLEIRTPCGTLVYDDATGKILADLVSDGQRFVAARGGKGGRGNASYKTSTNRAPRQSQPGLPGAEARLRLELKLIADVGLVGLPNAGKSTLIARISAARPKIADYPFTTLVPNLGVVRQAGLRDFVVADLPGLIQGASLGHGLGHQFLKHIERTRLILHLVDCQSPDPLADLEAVNHELRAFNPDLISRPQIVVITKADLAPESEDLQSLRAHIEKAGQTAHIISAVTGHGIEDLLGDAARALERPAPADQPKETWTP